MDENIIKEAVEEIQGASEEELKQVIEKWFESTRTEGIKIGASYISMGVYAAIRKNLYKKSKASLNDYRRCIKDILQIVEVQLKTKQNDSEESTDAGTTEDNSI